MLLTGTALVPMVRMLNSNDFITRVLCTYTTLMRAVAGGLLGCLGLFETPRGERAVSGRVGMRSLKSRYRALKPRCLPSFKAAIVNGTEHRTYSGSESMPESSNQSCAAQSGLPPKFSDKQPSESRGAWHALSGREQQMMADAFGFELGATPP